MELLRGVEIRLESPDTGIRNLLIRVSPLSILAFIVGMCSLFMPWLVQSFTGSWIWRGEWDSVMDVSLLRAISVYSTVDTVMLYSIVIGSFAVIFTSLAVIPLALGIVLFLNRWWDAVVLHLNASVDSLNHFSFAAGFFLAVLACILGGASAVPRVAPSVRLTRRTHD